MPKQPKERDWSTGRDAFLLKSGLNKAGVPPLYQEATLEECKAADLVGAYCERIRERVAAGQGLFIVGPVGVGKSCAAGIVAREALKAELTVRWEGVSELVEALEAPRTRREILDRMKHPDLLIWDDFGVQNMSPWQIAWLDPVVEYRSARRKTMIVTTNQDLGLLREDPALQRFVDRWRSMTRPLEIGGRSLRGQARNGGEGAEAAAG